MAKVSMYRGIDPTINIDSLIAVSEGRVAPSEYTGSSDPWLKPETFGKFEHYGIYDRSTGLQLIDALPTMELIWEDDF